MNHLLVVIDHHRFRFFPGHLTGIDLGHKFNVMVVELVLAQCDQGNHNADCRHDQTHIPHFICKIGSLNRTFSFDKTNCTEEERTEGCDQSRLQLGEEDLGGKSNARGGNL